MTTATPNKEPPEMETPPRKVRFRTSNIEAEPEVRERSYAEKYQALKDRLKT